jgi:predicted nuclease of predicted toxin-antitoxin system
MKFLLDVCVSSRTLQASLVAQGHEVLSAVAIDPKASDERLMAVAIEDDRVLVTEDKDFGELIFVRKLPHGPIVRLVELSIDEQVGGMAELLERYAHELSGPVIFTVTRGRIRIRRQEGPL